ncbi:hypothetical protein B9Z65_2522 [Elsinoe australis]|uniref:Uncharacterized protein n=1 Tax=Elsinoe australis TaxID=40998 RepID=A0A2P8A3V3_9PEZI|nr:hypothetical protein B9Z65_2522 [Elsinoe australis]
MALPSSPPLLAQDIPSSPPLPPVSFHSRKRHFAEDDNLSSDPVFSEDASEADDQPGFRKKRIYKGPWWAHSRSGQIPRKPSKFADSGVWLASESSDDGFLPSLSRQASASVAALIMDSPDSGEQFHNANKDTRPDRTLPAPETLAARIVLDCVDNSRPMVDLSDMSLKQLPGPVIDPLRQLVLARDMDQPDSDSFISLTPELEIYLANNALTCLPEELWSLENTSVLSLRNNALGELSGFVGKLRKLKELNIAGNGLHWLPWELLDLIRLRQGQVFRLIAHPNPLWQPVDSACVTSHSSVSFADPAHTYLQHSQQAAAQADRADPSATILASMIARVAATWMHRRQMDGADSINMTPVFGAASKIRYFELNGSPTRSTECLPSSQAEKGWPADLDATPYPPSDPSRAPSLFELCAETLRVRYKDHLPSLGASPWASDPVNRALRHLQQRRNRQLPACSACGRRYLFKRAEWVEYWHCNMSDRSVPSNLL